MSPYADRLATIVGESMGYDPQDLPFEVPLIDLGLDSLMAVRIKNRVEYEFDIPQLQLQAMRSACLADVEVHRVRGHPPRSARQPRRKRRRRRRTQHRGHQRLHRRATRQDAAAPTGRDPLTGVGWSPLPRRLRPTLRRLRSEEHKRRASDPASRQCPGNPETPAAESISSQEAAAAAAGSDVPPATPPNVSPSASTPVVTKRSAGGIFNKLPVLDEDAAQALTDRLNERTGDIDIEDILDSETIEEMSNASANTSTPQPMSTDSCVTCGWCRTARSPTTPQPEIGFRCCCSIPPVATPPPTRPCSSACPPISRSSASTASKVHWKSVCANIFRESARCSRTARTCSSAGRSAVAWPTVRRS